MRDWTSNLLIACALKKEVRGLKQGPHSRSRFVVTGLGTDRTSRTLEQVLSQWKPSLLIFTGMAGQLDPHLEMGEFLLPESWSFESGTEFRVLQVLADDLCRVGWKVSGKGLTVQVPIIRKSSRLEVFQKTGARICDMESAAALMVAQSFSVPCLAAKVVSDTAATGMMGFYRHFDRNITILGDHLLQLIASLE